jgi:hypothetical protein
MKRSVSRVAARSARAATMRMTDPHGYAATREAAMAAFAKSWGRE